jgi:hypothetical protein
LIVSIHQPHFLPWPGYFNKIINSDLYIYYDIVQYTRRNFQNRVTIKNSDMKKLWLTVPLKKDKQTIRIHDVIIFDPRDISNLGKTIIQAYGKSKYFSTIWPHLEIIFSKKYKYLSELNYDFLIILLKLMNIKTKILKSSEMGIKSSDPTKKLVEICENTGASYYLSGSSGKKYMDTSFFDRADIKIIYQNFNVEKFKYNQMHGDFIQGLSIVDALFNIGSQKTFELLKSNWSTGGKT